MNKMLMTGVAIVAAFAAIRADALSLADASGKIEEAVNDPAVLAQTVSQLPASDQAAYLAKVNRAIGNMPGSPAEKAAKYLDANKAAVKGASSENKKAMIAEVFATVPPEVLTLINEDFAENLVNRAADPSKTFTDAKYTEIAQSILKSVQDRTKTADNAGVRNTFAILMLLRASNGTPESLRDTLLEQLDPATREVARNDWIPPAMGEGQEKTYEPMLGASDAGVQPNAVDVVALVTPQIGVAVLSDLAGPSDSTAYTSAVLGTDINVIPDPMGTTTGMDRVPRTSDPSVKWFGGYRRGEPLGYPSQYID